MSDPKQKVKVKREHDGADDPAKVRTTKFLKDSPVVKGNNIVKVKKETDYVKREFATDVKSVKLKKETDTLKTFKKELHPVKKEKGIGGSDVGKVKIVKKEEVQISRGKVVSSKDISNKKKTSKEEAEKKGKKVYDLPGQKHDAPDERDPLRIFYESLYQQNPSSEMAEIWMMEHGLLTPDAAKKALERKKKSQLNQKIGTPVKLSKDSHVKVEKKISTLNGDSKASVKTKRKLDSDDDDDFIVKPKKKLKMHT